MTGRLLAFYAASVHSLVGLVLGFGLVCLLVCVTVPLDLLRWLYWRWLEKRVLSRKIVMCSAQHKVVLFGRGVAWVCEHCENCLESHAFDRCRWCGHRAAGVVCACSRFCRNPLWTP